MTADSLEAEGFELTSRFSVGVPHFVWKFDLDVEIDRELRLVEETVLRLVAAGVREQYQLAELMGLDDGAILPATIVDLLRKNALTFGVENQFALTPLGSEMLGRASARELRRYTDIEIRHDPYLDELRWSFDDQEQKERDLRARGLRAMPAPAALTEVAFEGRYREVQQVLERDGLPFEPTDSETAKHKREVIRLIAIKHYVAYREAQLEVWHHASRNEWRWRVMRGGGEELEVSMALSELESEGHTIIPLEERRPLVVMHRPIRR